jgi:hypothetical protein
VGGRGVLQGDAQHARPHHVNSSANSSKQGRACRVALPKHRQTQPPQSEPDRRRCRGRRTMQLTPSKVGMSVHASGAHSSSAWLCTVDREAERSGKQAFMQSTARQMPAQLCAPLPRPIAAPSLAGTLTWLHCTPSTVAAPSHAALVGLPSVGGPAPGPAAGPGTAAAAQGAAELGAV